MKYLSDNNSGNNTTNTPKYLLPKYLRPKEQQINKGDSNMRYTIGTIGNQTKKYTIGTIRPSYEEKQQSSKPITPNLAMLNRVTPQDLKQIDTLNRNGNTDPYYYEYQKQLQDEFNAKNPLSKFVENVQSGMRKSAFGKDLQSQDYQDYNINTSTGNKVADTTAGLIGNVLGFFVPTGGGQSFGSAVGNATEQAMSKYAPPKLTGLARIGVKGAAESLPYTAWQSTTEGLDAKDTAKQALLNAGLGAGGEIGLNLLGKGINLLRGSIKKPVQEFSADTIPLEKEPIKLKQTDLIRKPLNLQSFSPKGEYVDRSGIEINIGNTDKATARDIRQAYMGKYNKQVVTGNQLKDTIQKLASNEQNAISWYLDANGDKNYLKTILDNPDSRLDPYREDIAKALNLSANAQKAADMAKKYYQQAGEYSNDMGSINNILENYSNRMWKQPEPGKIKTEISKPGLNPYTSHSQQRVYEHLADGILNGKIPETTNAGDLLSLHNQEMARANTNRALAEALQNRGLGTYINGKPSSGFTVIDSLSKEKAIDTAEGPAIMRKNFVMPDGIANGIKAITDPDYMKKVDGFRNIQKYQGIVKTIDLSMSLFHHITLAAQALYNSRGGIDFIRHFDDLSKIGSESFNKAEQWGAEYGLMTTKMDDNYDILRKLTGDSGLWGKISNIPGIKQYLQFNEKNGEFLFGKVQRWLKVTDFQNKMLDYAAKNPNTTNEELTRAGRSIAEEVNSAYGGLNWKALGVTPSVQSALRLGFLAPDWTASSILMAKQALTKGPGGNAARAQYAIGLLGGAVLTEGLNYLFTGHFTDKNAKGHELEVEVQPDVYISMFRSGIGDATKLFSNIVQSGVGGGTTRFLQGKLSPLARTAIGIASNRDYTGRQIVDSANKTPLENELNFAKYVAGSASPIPFGAPSAVRYNQETNGTVPQKIIGNLLVDTGAGRYSNDNTQTGSVYDQPEKSYENNWLHRMLASGEERKQQDLTDKIKEMQKANEDNSKAAREYIGQQLQQGNKVSASDIIKKYGVTGEEAKTMITDSKNKLKQNTYSPLLRKYLSLSKANQKKFMDGLSQEEKQTLKNEINKFVSLKK